MTKTNHAPFPRDSNRKANWGVLAPEKSPKILHGSDKIKLLLEKLKSENSEASVIGVPKK